MARFSRRQFVGTSTGALLAVAGAGGSPSFAMQPVPRSGKTPLRLSLAAYSLRQHLELKLGANGAFDLFHFAELAAEWGFDAIEPTSYYFPTEGTEEFVHKLKRKALELGLDISGGAIRNNFILGPGDELEREFAGVQRWVDFYAELGAPVIRVFAGIPPKEMSPETAIDNAAKNLERACDAAGKRGVTLALENHDFLMKPDYILKIVERVQSPWFGVNLDSGNFPTADPYADLARLAPYALNVQIKVEMTSPAGVKSKADLGRVVDVLRKADYRGYVVLEHEANEDPLTTIPGYAEELRKLL